MTALFDQKLEEALESEAVPLLLALGPLRAQYPQLPYWELLRLARTLADDRADFYDELEQSTRQHARPFRRYRCPCGDAACDGTSELFLMWTLQALQTEEAG